MTQSLPIISKPQTKPYEIEKPPPNLASPPLKPYPSTLSFLLSLLEDSPSYREILTGPPTHTRTSPFTSQGLWAHFPWAHFPPGSYTSTSPFHPSKVPCSFPPYGLPTGCRIAFCTSPPPVYIFRSPCETPSEGLPWLPLILRFSHTESGLCASLGSANWSVIANNQVFNIYDLRTGTVPGTLAVSAWHTLGTD